MDLLQAVVLGIVQGATEFIPVSSSGHLVLVPWLLGWRSPGLIFDAVLHWGTLLAVIAYFWKDLVAMVTHGLRDLSRGRPLASSESRLGWLIVLATIPAALIGFLFEDAFEALFGRPLWSAFFLLITGLVLWVSEGLGRRVRELESIRPYDALLIGLAQAAAIAPGISRSGSTISVGLLRGMERPAAARFSFLMMIPIVFGAGLLKVVELAAMQPSGETILLLGVGFVAAAASGYACIAFLLRFLAERSIRTFAVYCWLLGAFSLAVGFLR